MGPRTRVTAELALPAGTPVVVDERLRDRDLGRLDRLTWRGIEARFPGEAEARREMGKFYHRPPGGESWTDVALRVRATLGDLRADHAGQRVVVVAHDVVVLVARYLIEGLDEASILGISAETSVRNCSLTRYREGPDGALALQDYNLVV